MLFDDYIIERKGSPLEFHIYNRQIAPFLICLHKKSAIWPYIYNHQIASLLIRLHKKKWFTYDYTNWKAEKVWGNYNFPSINLVNPHASTFSYVNVSEKVLFDGYIYTHWTWEVICVLCDMRLKSCFKGVILGVLWENKHKKKGLIWVEG